VRREFELDRVQERAHPAARDDSLDFPVRGGDDADKRQWSLTDFRNGVSDCRTASRFWREARSRSERAPGALVGLRKSDTGFRE
jgi:hypothetical protein